MTMFDAVEEMSKTSDLIRDIIKKQANIIAGFIIDKGGDITKTTKDDLNKLTAKVPEGLLPAVLTEALLIVGRNVPSSSKTSSSQKTPRGRGSSRPSWMNSMDD